MAAVLTVDAVRHRRGGRSVLHLDDLAVLRGERLAVLGPNGAGKTTLLRLLAAVEPPSRGRILIAERDPAGLAATELLALRRRIAYVTQAPALLAGTVLRNVELPLRWRGVAKRDRRERALAALERIGAAHLAGRRSSALSGGETQRVALARAMAPNPDVLLLDEPAAALDAEARAGFLTDVERALGNRRTTVVHVTHRVEDAIRLADRVAVLVEGRLRQVATVPDILRAPRDATVARLLGFENVLPVDVHTDGSVRFCGHVLLTRPGAAPGPAQLAVWAAGLTLTRAAVGDQCARALRVARVRPGMGRWELCLAGAAGGTAVIHLLPGSTPPQVDEPVAVTAHPSAAVLLPR